MRNQATRLDLLEAQEQRRQDRRDTLILIPVAAASIIALGHALAAFFIN